MPESFVPDRAIAPFSDPARHTGDVPGLLFPSTRNRQNPPKRGAADPQLLCGHGLIAFVFCKRFFYDSSGDLIQRHIAR